MLNQNYKKYESLNIEDGTKGNRIEKMLSLTLYIIKDS